MYGEIYLLIHVVTILQKLLTIFGYSKIYVYTSTLNRTVQYFYLQVRALTCNEISKPFTRSLVESAELYEECGLRAQLAVHLCVRLGAGVDHCIGGRRNAFLCNSCVVVPNEHFQAGRESGRQSVQHLIYYMERYVPAYTSIINFGSKLLNIHNLLFNQVF